MSHTTDRPAFVKACANRRRFVADIIRSIQNPEDYKILFEYVFPSKPAPNVTLPGGYKKILEGALLDGNSISDVQLENLRSDLMEALRKERSPLSLSLSPETTAKLEKVVMVTSPGWISTFQPTTEMVSTEHFFNSSNDTTPQIPGNKQIDNVAHLPQQNIQALRGPVGFVFLTIGFLIMAIVVRWMMSSVQFNSDSYALKQASIDASYGTNSKFRVFNNANETTGQMAESLFHNNVYSPNTFNSFIGIPGFTINMILQLAVLLLYVAILPFVLVIANMSKLIGLRNLQFIGTVESIIFVGNRHYNDTPRFTPIDQRKFIEAIQKAVAAVPEGGGDAPVKIPLSFGKYYKIDDLINNFTHFYESTKIAKLKILLKDAKLIQFVKNNLKRFMSMDDDGKYQFTQDALEQAMDSYNLLNFKEFGDVGRTIISLPTFLEQMIRNSFSYPILVKTGQSDLTYKIVPEYFWDVSTYQYLEIPPEFQDNQIPKLSFKVSSNAITQTERVEEVDVTFKPGSGVKLVNKFKEAPAPAQGQNQDPEAINVPKYLLVRDIQTTNRNQINPNQSAAFTRFIGLILGSVGSISVIFLILMGIVNRLEGWTGNYKEYDYSYFKKMVIVTSDAYYEWVERDDVHKVDIDKFSNFVSKTNYRIKIIDVSRKTTDQAKIDELIQVYNTDVASTSFISNQLFVRGLYILFILMLPFVAAWFIGLLDARVTFDMYGTKGLEGFQKAEAWLPMATIGLWLIQFIAASIQMMIPWYIKSGKDANLWKTVSETPSDRPHAPMKEANTSPSKFKTYSFLTTSGNDKGSSINRSEQQVRKIHTENMYNIKGFERTRVVFITDSDDLHGYYLEQIQPHDLSNDNEIATDQMKTDKQYNVTIYLIFGMILFILLAGLFLLGQNLTEWKHMIGGGVEAKESNILKSGRVVMDLLFKYMGAVQQPVYYSFKMFGGISYTLLGQIILFIIVLLNLFLSNLLPDNEIATGHGSGKHTHSTELAYGSLAYIERNALPA